MSFYNPLIRIAIYVFAIALSVLALLYPFLYPAIIQNTPPGQARLAETPLLLTGMIGISLVVLIHEIQAGSNTKTIALLGVLVAINATLRFVEVGIPGPGGFSPIFFLIILTGYVFGGSFGFLIGSLTMFVSALVTGGIGPWLPSQMLAAGWVGLSAVLLVSPIRRVDQLIKRSKWKKQVEVISLAGFGFLWGLLYGLIMNLWSWPYFSGPADQYWNLGLSVAETIQRYLSYYVVTSLVWDLSRAIGSAILLLAFGIPTLRALRRFQLRFKFNLVEEAGPRKTPSPIGNPTADPVKASE